MIDLQTNFFSLNLTSVSLKQFNTLSACTGCSLTASFAQYSCCCTISLFSNYYTMWGKQGAAKAVQKLLEAAVAVAASSLSS